MGLIIAQSDHNAQRYRFRVKTTKFITFRGHKDGFIRRAVGSAAKSAEYILQKWESIDPAGNDLQPTTLSMLLEDVNNAVQDYATIAGRQWVQALLGLLRNLNRGKKHTGLFQVFQDEGGGERGRGG